MGGVVRRGYERLAFGVAEKMGETGRGKEGLLGLPGLEQQGHPALARAGARDPDRAASVPCLGRPTTLLGFRRVRLKDEPQPVRSRVVAAGGQPAGDGIRLDRSFVEIVEPEALVRRLAAHVRPSAQPAGKASSQPECSLSRTVPGVAGALNGVELKDVDSVQQAGAVHLH